MKPFKQHITESSAEISQIFSRVLARKFPQKISINHQDNLVTITFEVRKGSGSIHWSPQHNPGLEKPIRDQAVKLSNQLMKELRKKIGIEDTQLDFDPNDPDVTLFMVSDEFIGMPKPYLPSGK